MARNSKKTTNLSETVDPAAVKVKFGDLGEFSLSKFLHSTIMSNLKRMGYTEVTDEQKFFLYSRLRGSEDQKDFQKYVEQACTALEDNERKMQPIAGKEDAIFLWARFGYVIFGRHSTDDPKDDGLNDAIHELRNRWVSLRSLEVKTT